MIGFHRKLRDGVGGGNNFRDLLTIGNKQICKAEPIYYVSEHKIRAPFAVLDSARIFFVVVVALKPTNPPPPTNSLSYTHKYSGVYFIGISLVFNKHAAPQTKSKRERVKVSLNQRDSGAVDRRTQKKINIFCLDSELANESKCN